MGTRHLIAVYHNGQPKIAQYGQWDGYPEGQGRKVLSFLKEHLDQEKLINSMDRCFLPSEADFTTMYARVGCDYPGDGFISYDKSLQFSALYPSLSRDTGANILSVVQYSEDPVPLRNSIEFAADSLFCEWAYVVDLDTQVFEVYRGFNRGETVGRFKEFTDNTNTTRDYNPVTLIVSYPLSDLPHEEEFIEQVTKLAYPEEEQE